MIKVMNTHLKKFNDILLSNNVKNNFYDCFNSNNEFKTWLLKILPEIEDCRQQTQNNPWHIYNVLDHILVSVEEINKLSTTFNNKDKRLLSYVMLLHDIGKPEHHIKVDRNGLEVDIFPNHQMASEKIASRVLKDFKFNEIETTVIKKLVEQHDYFMHTFKNEIFSIERFMKEAEKNITNFNKIGNGYKINQMLILVSLADNMAQNPLLTKASIEIINRYASATSNLKSLNPLHV